MRYVAGRPAWHAKTAAALRLDVRRLHRDGYLGEPNRMTWRWSSGATIGLDTTPDAVTLNYRYKDHSDEWRSVDQRIAITRTPCHYGGSRPWFVCPCCRRRCALVYLWNWPKCRTCARLVYPSQSDDAIGRSWSRTYRILRRLGQGDEWPHAVPRRPKGMRHATFERLWQAWCREEGYRDDMLAAFVARLGHLL